MPKDTITITAITENTTLRQGLLAQHGQCLLIDYFGRKYLFDTAEVYEAFIYNLTKLGLQLGDIAGFIYSHKHLDHAGSLPEMLDTLTNQPVYILPDFGTPDLRNPHLKYSLYQPEPDGRYNVALSPDQAAAIKAYAHTIIVEQGLQIEENFFLTGVVEGEIAEQAVVINVPVKGLVVLVGCSHPSLDAMIQKAQEVSGRQKIYGLIGGLHLKDASPEKIDRTIEFIQSLELEFVIPSHCTGYLAIRRMQEVLGGKVMLSGTGQFGAGNRVRVYPELAFELV